MIGYGSEIDGPINLRAQRLITVGVRQGNDLSFSVFVGAIGIIFLIGEVGIEGIACVDMQVAKEGEFGIRRYRTGHGLLANRGPGHQQTQRNEAAANHAG